MVRIFNLQTLLLIMFTRQLTSAEKSGKSRIMPFFQPKLTVNTPGDAHEQEADRVADQVMRMHKGDVPIVQRMPLTSVSGGVLRKCTACEYKEEEKQGVKRKESGGSDASGKTAPQAVSDVLSSGGGQALDGSTRQFMESRFGQDFSQVRIHTNGRASESAQAIQAKAYTSGRDIVFGSGEYQPSSEGGKRLLAHELVHVGHQFNNNESLVNRQTTTTPPATTPCPDASSIVTAAASRCLGDIGTAYDKGASAGWWYSPNGNLEGARTKAFKWELAQGAKNPLPDLNYIINWGNEYTCNLFVYDVLHQAGLAPPVAGNNHYYDALQTYNLNGKLRAYFEEITDRSLVCPGDIMATGIHMEIVATKVDSSNNYQSFGGHTDGAYSSARTASITDKFFRVK